MKKIFTITIIGLLCLSMFLTFPPKTKAETDSSFETGFEGWEPYTQAGGSLVQLSTTYAHSGQYSIEQKGQSSGSESNNSVGGIRFPVTCTLDRYELSCWAYVTERSSANAGSFFGFAFNQTGVNLEARDLVGWNPWGSSSSYVYVRQSEGYQPKGDWYNPVPYGLTLNTWHQVNVTAYVISGTVSIWLDGSLIVDNWPAFNAGEEPYYYNIECAANYYGTYIMHQFVDDVQISKSAGPIAYWKFDEGSGNIANDSSGNGNDGVIHTATWTDGIFGKALHFNGVDSWVEVPSSPTLTGLSQITLEAWIQEDSIPSRPNGIISKCDGWAPPTNAEYFLGTVDGGRVFFETDNSVAIFSSQSAQLITQVGRWYHVAGVWSGGSYVIYVDGQAVLSGTCTPQTTLSNSLPVQIGRHGNWPWVYFQGIIDEVKIYNYARTAEEIQVDYVSGTSARAPVYFSVEPVAVAPLTDINASINGLETPPTPYPVGGSFTVEIHLRGATQTNVPAGVAGVEAHFYFGNILSYAIPTGFTNMIGQIGGVLNGGGGQPIYARLGFYDANDNNVTSAPYTGAIYYEVAAANTPAPWNGADGIVAKITFKIIKQPHSGQGEQTVSFPLALVEIGPGLEDGNIVKIPHDIVQGTLTIDASTSTVPGDLDGDGQVTLADLSQMVLWYGMTSSNPNWNVPSGGWVAPSAADFNGNGRIDLADLVTLAMYYSIYH